jgi:hypothetical protein
MAKTLTPNVFAFEANPTHIPALKAARIPFYIGVLSSPKKKKVKFHYNNTTGDSYYKEKTMQM